MSERAYEVRGGGLETMWQDLRFGVRTLVRNPGFAAVAILTLALGTGATSAIFSFGSMRSCSDRSYREPERLLSVAEHRNGVDMALTAPDYLDWRGKPPRSSSLPRRQGRQPTSPIVANPSASSPCVSPATTSTRWAFLLRMAGDSAGAMNRTVRRVSRCSVMVSGVAALPGIRVSSARSIAINGEPHVVVGIMRRQLSLRSTGSPTLAAAQSHTAGTAGARGRIPRRRWTSAARRHGHPGPGRAGRNREESREGQTAVQRQGDGARRSLHEAVVAQVRDAAFILLAAVSFVLLIACANVANLLLARATRRHAEMSVRAALGASRSRIARQLLTESAVIGLAGAIAGLALAFVIAELLKGILPEDIPRLQQTRVDAVVLGFTLAVTLVASLVFGVAPAVKASRPELQQALRDESRSSAGLRRRRLSSSIVAAEIALALVLLVAAGLLLRSFVRLQRVELGFDPANLLIARMDLPEARYGTAVEAAAFYQELATSLGQQPGVTTAAVASHVPLAGSGFNISMTIEDAPSRHASRTRRWCSCGSCRPGNSGRSACLSREAATLQRRGPRKRSGGGHREPDCREGATGPTRIPSASASGSTTTGWTPSRSWAWFPT